MVHAAWCLTCTGDTQHSVYPSVLPLRSPTFGLQCLHFSSSRARSLKPPVLARLYVWLALFVKIPVGPCLQFNGKKECSVWCSLSLLSLSLCYIHGIGCKQFVGFCLPARGLQ
jgi:hypothetical protein